MRPIQLPALLAAALLGLALTAAPASAQFFNAVFSRNSIDVIAVGDSGALHRSVNGGANWARWSLGDKPLRDVVAHDLVIVVAGDSGKVWRSADFGGTWSLAVMDGVPSLRRLEALGGDSLMVVGSGGTVLLSTDDGVSFSPQTSGTGERINSVRFLDSQNGWIAGTNGFLARTADGGASWTPVALGTANHLNCVDAKGAAVWVVGDDATAFHSTDSGDNWTQLDLHADAQPDVKAVWVQSADSVYITGGGGFIRRSYDGGGTWSFLQHTLQGQISDLYFLGANGWAASSRVRAVMRTTDRGTTWSMPAGSSIGRAWVIKLSVSATVRGSTIAVNPVYKSTLYAAMGNIVYRSRNEGETWSNVSTIPGASTIKTNSFIVSAKDSNYWVAAVGNPDRIVWSDNAGASWNDAVLKSFGEYGIPLEVDPDRPDTMYFGVDSDSLMRSIDRGKTWSEWSSTVFRSPCDIVVVPESDSAVILVGDGITSSGFGKYWRSAGGSPAFTDQLTVSSSEIPGLAGSRLRNTVAFGTNWSSGGVERSTNRGLTWPGVHTASSAWGVDIARDDPDCVVFGIYGGTVAYISLTGGATGSFTTVGGLSGPNYGIYARDRGTILAEQGGGIYKLNVTHSLPTTQTVAVTSPNGGEVWLPGSAHDITWNALSVVMARVEYRRTPSDPWQLVAEVEGPLGRYTWTVPYDATAEAHIQVSDAWDQAPADSSNQEFTIALPLIAETPASLGFGSHPIGSATLGVVTISNPGTAPLVLSSIAAGTGAFQAGRSSLTLAAGASDTVGVTFLPGTAVAYTDQLTLESNGYNAPTWLVPLYGSGMDTLALDLASPDGGEQWRYGTGQKIEWASALVSAVDIEYQVSPTGPWIAIADSVADAPKSYVWVIPSVPTSECLVRVRQHGGGVEDVSKEVFSLTVAYLAAAPSPLDLGTTSVNVVRGDVLEIDNAGNAPLTISSVASSNPRFWPGRSSLVVAAGGSDTVGVFYLPAVAGYDSATLTIAADDPSSPHAILVVGRSVQNVGVEGRVPQAFALWQNRPNPFTGRTQIRYALPVGARVSLEVFNVKGERVATLVDQEQGPGEYSVGFGAGAAASSGARRGALASGIYFYRFRAGGFVATHRMVLMK